MLRQHNNTSNQLVVWAALQRDNLLTVYDLRNRLAAPADPLESGYGLCHCRKNAHCL